MRKILFYFIILLPAGILSLLLPLPDYINLIIFTVFFTVDLIFLLRSNRFKEMSAAGKPEIIPETDIGDSMTEKAAALQENKNIVVKAVDESFQKINFQQLSSIKEGIIDICNHVQNWDKDENRKELTVLTNEFFPCIEQAKSDSVVIEGNISQIYNISDNLSKTAQEAFDLAENVRNEIKIVTGILNKAMHVTDVLSKKSTEISQILEIMSNLSSNIHVLSINASIVSARAGVYGKGFEVVAKEIRKLAEDTDHSLGDINGHVDDIQNAVDDVVVEIKEAGTAINQEAQTLTAVAGSLQGVLLSVEIVNTVSVTAKNSTISQSSHYKSMTASLDKLLYSLDHRFIMDKDEINICRNYLDKISMDMDTLIGRLES